MPHRLLGAVAHEPPLVQVLPAGSPERGELEDIARLGRDKGAMRAFAAFGAMTMPRPPWIFRSAWGQAAIAAASRCALSIGAVARSVTGRAPSPMTRMPIGLACPVSCFPEGTRLTSRGRENSRLGSSRSWTGTCHDP